jgi:hypothetical protein
MELSTFSSDEKCDEEKDECYTVTKQKIPFSVRPENAETVNLLMKSLNHITMILRQRQNLSFSNFLLKSS